MLKKLIYMNLDKIFNLNISYLCHHFVNGAKVNKEDNSILSMPHQYIEYTKTKKRCSCKVKTKI